MLDLGSAANGRRVALTDRERTRHMAVLGATGSGKSKFLEHLVRQDIRSRRGLCLVDPKGSLADNIETWCASRGYGRTRPIHVVKPGEGTWTAGFNPLRLDRGEVPNVRVDAAVAACSQVWGGEDLNQTPRLKKILRALFFALAVRNLTIAEAPYLLRPGDPEGTRRALTEGLPDAVFQFIWDDLNALTRREFSEYSESTVSRVAQFLTSPAVRLMLGQQSSAIDFRKVMDEGDIVIVNLAPRNGFSYEDARMVGALIVNDLFLAALTRDERMGARRPFSLYVDECHDFVTSDIERLLDRTRSLGLHAVLAHQRLDQLMSRGKAIYSAVMGSTRTKVVFGLESDDDAGIMARQLMRDEIDLQEAKPILDRQVVVGERRHWLNSESWSETEGGSDTVTDTTGTSDTEGESTGEGLSFNAEEGALDENARGSESEGRSSAHSSHTSRAQSEGRSWSRSQGGGRHEAIGSRWGTARTPYSLEEQFHRAQAVLRSLPDRYAIVKRSGMESVRIRTDEVTPPLCAPAMLSRFREAVAERSPYVAQVSQAEAEIAARQMHLGGPRGPPGEVSFWSE